MELKNDFGTFLEKIRPTKDQQDDLRRGHKTLRERLNAYEDLKTVIVSDFLQGSYRRSTAVRPNGDQKADVDIIVVTNLDENEFTPAAAMDTLKPFLNEHYKGKWRQQGRSFGITLSYVEMDLVLTAAPSEVQAKVLKSASVRTDDALEDARDWRLNDVWLPMDQRSRLDAHVLVEKAKAEPEWKTEPLRIPDHAAEVWDSTHPLEQIRWTRDKNAKTAGHFVNVVKALKWWRVENHEEPKHPKGFPLERLIGECCPDDIDSVAEGITLTLENIVTEYAATVGAKSKPTLPDYGVPSHDVFKRITVEDFATFYAQAKDAAKLAREAFDSEDRTESGNLWRKLLGNKFPEPPKKKVGFAEPKAPAIPGSGRFA